MCLGDCQGCADSEGKVSAPNFSDEQIDTLIELGVSAHQEVWMLRLMPEASLDFLTSPPENDVRDVVRSLLVDLETAAAALAVIGPEATS